MDQEACLGFDDDDDISELVDLTAPAMSAAAYLRQMQAERKTVPQCAVNRPKDIDCASPEAKKQRRQWLEGNGVIRQEKKIGTTHGSLLPSEEWQRFKSRQFGAFREKTSAVIDSTEPMKIKALRHYDEEKWHEILLEKCIPEFEHVMEKFPNHTGTPPSFQMVLAIPKKHLSHVIEYLIDWSTEEGLTRPIREWIYALLVVIDQPLVQDVVSAIRNMAKECKNLRSQLSEDRKEEAFEYSMFIAIIGIYFGQKDVSDLV